MFVINGDKTFKLSVLKLYVGWSLSLILPATFAGKKSRIFRKKL